MCRASKLPPPHVVGSHDAAQFADLVHADGFAALPVLALDDADRGAVRLVAGMQPDVHATIGAVALAAGHKAGLGEQGFNQRLEAAPFDDVEHVQAPRGRAWWRRVGLRWRWAGRGWRGWRRHALGGGLGCGWCGRHGGWRRRFLGLFGPGLGAPCTDHLEGQQTQPQQQQGPADGLQAGHGNRHGQAGHDEGQRQQKQPAAHQLGRHLAQLALAGLPFGGRAWAGFCGAWHEPGSSQNWCLCREMVSNGFKYENPTNDALPAHCRSSPCCQHMKSPRASLSASHWQGASHDRDERRAHACEAGQGG